MEPPTPPPLETQFLEVLREVGGGGSKTDPPFFGSKSRIFFLRVSWSQLHGVCIGRSGTSDDAVYARFTHFCYIGGFGDLGDPVVPTLRGVSGDVGTVYAYQDTKGLFWIL